MAELIKKSDDLDKGRRIINEAFGYVLGDVGSVISTGGHVDFDYKNEVIKFFENNRIIWRDEYYTLDSDTSLPMRDKDGEWYQLILFDINSKQLKVEKFYKKTNFNENTLVLGQFYTGGSVVFNGLFSVNGIKTESYITQGEMGFLFPNNSLNFSFGDNKIEIPSASRVVWRNNLFIISDSKEIDISEDDSIFMLVVFDVDEEKFGVVKASSEKLNESHIILGGYDSNKEEVFLNGRYRVNGKYPIDSNDDEDMINGIPDYFKEEIKNINREVTDKQSNNTLTFAFLTDIHASEGRHQEYGLRHLRNLREFSKRGQLDFIAIGGDIINGTDDTKDKSLDRLSELMSEITDVHVPVYCVFGNHDSNGMVADDNRFDRLITKDEWYNYTIRPFKNDIKHDKNNPMSAYYYADYDNQKTRVIILDSIDHPYEDAGDNEAKYHGRNYRGFEQQQIDWLCNEALQDVPENYKILLLSHTPIRKDYMIYDTEVSNGVLVENILDAFQNGESYSGSDEGLTDTTTIVDVDFSEQGEREVIALIVGHSHVDGIFEDSDTGLGYPVINVPCSKNDERNLNKDYFHDNLSWASVPERESRTVTEDAWDTITIDFNKNKIYLTRFGAGDDREVDF